MSYLVSKTRAASLTINGTDYTQNLSSWTVSDASALTSGLVSTSGSLTLNGLLGGPLLQDYDRNNFRRGAEVVLEVSGQAALLTGILGDSCMSSETDTA